MGMMEEQETPYIYDYICALWSLSVAMGRSVIVDRPRAPVHLNMYVILVSESGIMRKSSSIRVATGLVRRFLTQQNSPMALIESKVTMGMLLNELSIATQKTGSSQMVVVASELAAVLGRGTAVAGVPALLTDLYDCPDSYSGGGSLKTGRLAIRDVYSSFLAGSTPSWLARAVRPEIVEGGFTSRCYIINGRNRKRAIAWPEVSADEQQRSLTTSLELLEGLKRDARSFGRIGITSGAKSTFTQWYERRPIHNDPYRESFESREDSHILRLAGLMAINDGAWEISDDHLRRGIAFVSHIKRCGTDLFTGVTVERRDVKILKKVRDLLISSGTGGITRGNLYRTLSIPGRGASELRAILSTMHELDLVTMYEDQPQRGRPRTIYVATEYLKNEQFLEDVARKLGME